MKRFSFLCLLSLVTTVSAQRPNYAAEDQARETQDAIRQQTRKINRQIEDAAMADRATTGIVYGESKKNRRKSEESYQPDPAEFYRVLLIQQQQEEIARLKAEAEQPKIAPPAQSAAAQTKTKFEVETEASWNKTFQAFPAAADENSPFSKRMIEIANRLEKDGNPAVFRSDSPWIIARMVADEIQASKAAK